MTERDESDLTKPNRFTEPDDRYDQEKLDAEQTSEHPPANVGEKDETQ